jgi:hypothetical protein
MPRKRPAPPDDDGVQLTPRPTAQQLQELRARGYRGPSPSTEHQAQVVLSRLRASQPTPPEDGR